MMNTDQKHEKEQQDARHKERMKEIKHKILVMSGKGGVGKTTVAVNLALGLSVKGYKVGILDTDIHGPNISKMLGIDHIHLESTDDGGIKPVEVNQHLKAVSLALVGHRDDVPVIWRGPLKTGLIRQFLSDVHWGKLDYLIIDSPPGTGDEPLTVCQLLPELSGSIIVTTPQGVAILDSRKSINFSKQLNIPILGVVENMSGFVCPHCGEVSNLFGYGGGEKSADDFGIPFLGRIPLEQELMEAEDRGELFLTGKRNSKSAEAMQAILDKILKALSEK